MLSIDLLDEEGTQIVGAIFNEAVDMFHGMLREGRVYLVSGGCVKMAAKKFTSIKNDYILNIDNTATIVPLGMDDTKIKSLEISCITLSEIGRLPSGTVVDVIAAVKSVSPAMDFVAKTGRKTVKRSLKVVDDSGAEIELVLWNLFATQREIREGEVVAFKNIRIVAFNGRQLSTVDQSAIIPDPIHPRADAVRMWLAKKPDTAGFRQLTEEFVENCKFFVCEDTVAIR